MIGQTGLSPNLWISAAAAVHEAHRTGLLAALLEADGSAPELAARARLSPRVSGLVLELLVAIGLVEARPTEGGGPARLAAGADLRAWAAWSPGGPGLQREVWSALGPALAGEDPGAAWTDRAARYPGVVRGLGAIWGAAPAALAAAVGPGSSVVDVGCGDGTWGRALVAPGGALLGIDLPTVLERFREAGAEAASTGRHTEAGLAGDLFAVDVPLASADRVVLANVLRLEPAPRAAAALIRWAAALKPGGKLIVVDALAGGTPELELERAAYALHLGLRFPEGEVHRPERVRAWMRDAGLEELGTLAFPGAPGASAALIGVRPC